MNGPETLLRIIRRAELSLGWVRLLIDEKKKKGESEAALVECEKKWLARIEEAREDFEGFPSDEKDP